MSVTRQEVARNLDRDRLVERLRQLVRIPSENPPGEEAAAGELVSSFCADLGLEVEIFEIEPGRPNVVARWRGDEPGPTLGYCSHLDVVPVGERALWDHEPFGAEISDGRLHGRGASDAKGPVAAALEAVAALRAARAPLAGVLELELVSDEETMGGCGAGALVDRGVLHPDIAIVGEPTALKVVHAQRGACWLRVTTRGVAGHGSAPERGVSAIRHMAEIVLQLDASLPDVVHPVLGGPSINVGTISGGAKVNVVPAACVIEIDRRSVPPEKEEDVLGSVHAAVEAARARFPDIEAEVEMSFYGEPFEIPSETRVVQVMAGATAEARNADAELTGFRGASDARFLARAGAEVIVCGPGDISLAHSARESIDLGELEHGALAYALAFARLLDPAEHRASAT
jgi:succinyl-diaminopimelate desuccinylase